MTNKEIINKISTSEIKLFFKSNTIFPISIKNNSKLKVFIKMHSLLVKIQKYDRFNYFLLHFN